jgi:hypothetical protein
MNVSADGSAGSVDPVVRLSLLNADFPQKL